MNRLVPVLLCWLLMACQPKDIQARLLLGRWVFVESTSTSILTVYKANPAWPQYAIFNADGTTGQEAGSYPFTGGACNHASTYAYTKDGAYSYSPGKIQFTFSEPRCFTFMYVPEQPNATILELTDTTLLISWNSLLIRYKRA